MTEDSILKNKLRRPLLIATIINSVYLALFFLMGLAAGLNILVCHSSVGSLLEDVHNAEADSFLGGYTVMGGLLGAGTLALFEAVLYLMLLVCGVFILLFLADGIGGYRLCSRLKQQEFGAKLCKKMKKNAVLKCIAALLILVPLVVLFFDYQWYVGAVFFAPQLAVLLLSAHLLWLLHQTKPELQTEAMNYEP